MYSLQFLTWILSFQAQQFPSPKLKQTFLVTLPSVTLGWAPFNQPGAMVLHFPEGGHVVVIILPASPWKRNHPGPRLSSFLSTSVRDVKLKHSKKNNKFIN